MKKKYIVEWREVLVTTYEVEAEDEDDAMDVVRCGDGVRMAPRDTEPMPGGADDMTVTEKETD